MVIIGGSFFSTSSGIRFVKIYSLFKFSINELASHAKPLNIYVNKLEFSNSKLETNDIYRLLDLYFYREFYIYKHLIIEHLL